MALREWNVREALTAARDGYFLPRAADSRLAPVDQAQSQEMANACDRSLNALGQDDTMPQGQRQARFSDLVDKIKPFETVEQLYALEAQELYDGCDLVRDAADRFLVGETTFSSSVGSAP